MHQICDILLFAYSLTLETMEKLIIYVFPLIFLTAKKEKAPKEKKMSKKDLKKLKKQVCGET